MNETLTTVKENPQDAQEKMNILLRLWYILTHFHDKIVDDIVKIFHGDQAAQTVIEALKTQASENNLAAMETLNNIVTRVAGINGDYDPEKGMTDMAKEQVAAIIDGEIRDYHNFLAKGIPLKNCTELMEDGKLKANVSLFEGQDDCGNKTLFLAETNDKGEYVGGTAYQIQSGSMIMDAKENRETVRFIPVQVEKTDKEGEFTFKDNGGKITHQGAVKPAAEMTSAMQELYSYGVNKEHALLLQIISNCATDAFSPQMRLVYDETVKKLINNTEKNADKVRETLFDEIATSISNKYDGFEAKLDRRKNNADKMRLDLIAEDGTTIVMKQTDNGSVVAYFKGEEDLNLIEIKRGEDGRAIQTTNIPDDPRSACAIKMLTCDSAQFFTRLSGIEDFAISLEKVASPIHRSDPNKPFEFRDPNSKSRFNKFKSKLESIRTEDNKPKYTVTTNEKDGAIFIETQSDSMVLGFTENGLPSSMKVTSRDSARRNPDIVKSIVFDDVRGLAAQSYSGEKRGTIDYAKDFDIPRILNDAIEEVVCLNKDIVKSDQAVENYRNNVEANIIKDYSFLPKTAAQAVARLAIKGGDTICTDLLNGKVSKEAVEERLNSFELSVTSDGQTNPFREVFDKSPQDDVAFKVSKASSMLFLASNAAVIKDTLVALEKTDKEAANCVESGIKNNLTNAEELFTMPSDKITVDVLHEHHFKPQYAGVNAVEAFRAFREEFDRNLAEHNRQIEMSAPSKKLEPNKTDEKNKGKRDRGDERD